MVPTRSQFCLIQKSASYLKHQPCTLLSVCDTRNVAWQFSLTHAVPPTGTANFGAADVPSRWDISYAVVSVPLVQKNHQAKAGIKLTPSAGMFHYVINRVGPFTGFLQHLVTNNQVGVVTDMTTACTMAVN